MLVIVSAGDRRIYEMGGPIVFLFSITVRTKFYVEYTPLVTEFLWYLSTLKKLHTALRIFNPYTVGSIFNGRKYHFLMVGSILNLEF